MHFTKITESDARITVSAPSTGLQTAILAFSSALCVKGMQAGMLTFASTNHKTIYL